MAPYLTLLLLCCASRAASEASEVSPSAENDDDSGSIPSSDERFFETFEELGNAIAASEEDNDGDGKAAPANNEDTEEGITSELEGSPETTREVGIYAYEYSGFAASYKTVSA